MKIGITERGDAGLYLNEVLNQIKKKKVDASILITKAPNILVENFNKLPKNIIIHCTITGLSKTLFEPNVPKLNKAFEAYKSLINKLGYEKVVLRIDPIIPIYPFSDYALYVAKNLFINKNQRLRISFLDLYSHVRRRLKNIKSNDLIKRFNYQINNLYKNKHFPLKLREEFLNNLLKIYNNIEICAEPEMNNTGCISNKDLKILNLPIIKNQTTSYQRTLCQCLNIKTELLKERKPCKFNCLYCYWK